VIEPIVYMGEIGNLDDGRECLDRLWGREKEGTLWDDWWLDFVYGFCGDCGKSVTTPYCTYCGRKV
jgi:hypothetical protein